jgi:hypothetical protein
MPPKSSKRADRLYRGDSEFAELVERWRLRQLEAELSETYIASLEEAVEVLVAGLVAVTRVESPEAARGLAEAALQRAHHLLD